MVRPRLEIVAGVAPALDRSGSRGRVAGIGITLLALAVVASLLGADHARRTLLPREVAATVLEIALDRGSDDPEVRSTLIAMRDSIARRPLDTKTRVAFSDVTLNVARTIDDLEVAAFHAGLAARLTPVTVPVVRNAALVLLNTGHLDECQALIRAMFGYDAGAASRLLVLAEPLLTAQQVERAIAETPEAWREWVHLLRQTGRAEEADRWLEAGFGRWPDDLALLARVAGWAVRARDWEKLEGLFQGRELPIEPGAAMLHVHRARLHSRLGNPERVAADLATALRLGSRSASVHLGAGDVHLAMGNGSEARSSWNRALFLLEPGRTASRAGILRRLARLEEAQGKSGTALRHWRAILSLDSDDEEARRQISALTGSSP